MKHILLMLLVICSLSCKRTENFAQNAFFAMGTVVVITVPDTATESANKAEQLVLSLASTLQEDCTRISESEELVQISEYTYKLLYLGEQYRRKSEGIFNVAVPTVSKLYGFPEGPYHEADPRQLEAAKKLIASTSLVLYKNTTGFYADGNGLSVDLGAFGKGWIVDEAAKLLRKEGVRDFIVNAGGDVYTAGKHTDRLWHMGITDPTGKQLHIDVVALSNKALATSGIYERYFVTEEGKHISHLFDGRNSETADKYTSVSVIADTAMLADLYSTLYFFEDHEEIRMHCKEHNTSVMTVDNSGKRNYYCGWENYTADM